MQFFNVLEKKCCRDEFLKNAAAAAPPWTSLVPRG
jgi:hypothetical protein